MQDAGTILAGCPFFQAVKPAQFAALRQMAIVRTYPLGAMIFRQNQECPGVFVVGSGLVRLFKTAASGKEHVLHLVSAGQTFAEVAAIGGFDCPAYAEALEETVCVVLPAEEFRRALERDHQLCLQLMGSMAGWVKHFLTLMEDLTLRDAIGRVSRYLLDQVQGADGAVHLPSAKKHLASHLNLTSETLSRTLRRLADQGAIDIDAEGITVKDAQALQGLADGIGPLL